MIVTNDTTQRKHVKKTRQGSGRGTKFGSIGSKHYVKKYRGQGGGRKR